MHWLHVISYAYWPLLSWVIGAVWVAALFISLIFVRITVPRFKLESLSRLGWLTLLGLYLAVVFVYLVALGLS